MILQGFDITGLRSTSGKGIHHYHDPAWVAPDQPRSLKAYIPRFLRLCHHMYCSIWWNRGQLMMPARKLYHLDPTRACFSPVFVVRAQQARAISSLPHNTSKSLANLQQRRQEVWQSVDLKCKNKKKMLARSGCVSIPNDFRSPPGSRCHPSLGVCSTGMVLFFLAKTHSHRNTPNQAILQVQMAGNCKLLIRIYLLGLCRCECVRESHDAPAMATLSGS